MKILKKLEVVVRVCVGFGLSIWLLIAYIHYQNARSIDFEFAVTCSKLESTFFDIYALDQNGERITRILAFEKVRDWRFDAYEIDPPYSGSPRGYDPFHEMFFSQSDGHYIAMINSASPATLEDSRMTLDRKSLILMDDYLRAFNWPAQYWQCSIIGESELNSRIEEAKALPATEGNRI